MFKKVKMGQEEPFKGNSGELGLFSNGRAEGNSRCVVFHMGGVQYHLRNVLNKKHVKFKQNLEKRRDKKWKQFQQNTIKERRARKSHTDTGYRKTTKVESILTELKLEQRVMLEGNENNVDVYKRKDDRPIFAQIAPNKNITDNRKFRKKRSKTYAEAMQSVQTSNSGGEVVEPLKPPNVLKEKNHDFNRIIGIDLESIYARLR